MLSPHLWRSGPLAALFLLLPLLVMRALPASPAAQSLADADRYFQEKSYAAALEGYERLLGQKRVPAERADEVQYRIAISLGKTQKWDRAVESGVAFVKAHRGTVWEARGLYWLGRLYLGVPHQGYRTVEKAADGTPRPHLHRGNDVPQNVGEEKPEQVVVTVQDLQNAHDALEAARVDYGTYRAQHHTEAEEIQLDFDLARLLPTSAESLKRLGKKTWLPPTDPSWHVDPAVAYSPKWAPPKKERYLFEQIRLLAKAAGAGRHSAALADLGEAVWVRGYRRMMENLAVRWENGKANRIPYPYQNLRSETILRHLIESYPDDPARDQAQYTLGLYQAEDGKSAPAVAELRRFIEERPASKWTEDARYQLQQITSKQLSLSALPQQVAGQPRQKVTVSARNVKSIHFELYRTRVQDVLANPDRLNDPDTSFTDFQRNFGGRKGEGRYLGPRVAAWDLTTGDKGDYQYTSHEVAVPFPGSGGYVLQASVSGITQDTLLIDSDLVLVERMHRDGALFFVSDALSGKPVANVEIVAKQWWYEGGKYHCAFRRGHSSADGTWNAPLLRAPGRMNFRMAGFAFRDERYALTDGLSTWDNGDNPATIQVFSTTDRPVYRPRQPVFFRELVLRRERGALQPVANRQVHVEVTDPRGQRIYERTETSSSFGSVNGKFDLPSGAPLGEYQVQVSVPAEANGPTQWGGNRFRVEEYKKPEFEVTVTPAAERVRLGQPTSAKVHAEYYFGGPVPRAKVSYRVYRNYYAQSYRFPRPFDFLYQPSNNGDYDTYYRNGEVIAQGEARTDDQGDAKVSFPTSTQGSRWGESDLSYTVEADVQDESRRVISGTGSLKATKHDVAVFLDFPHGFATQGDRVDVEVMTVNPSDQPVSVSGTAKVYRQPATPDGKEQLIHQEPLQTDSHGRAILKWKTDTSGYFRIAFETRDSAEQEVAGSTMVWVDGPELARGRFVYQNIALQVENLYYEEGQTARVLLVTPAPDATILLTREANNEILERQVLHVKGRSLELKIPLAGRDVPNVFLAATMVRNGQMYQATQELFVPPVRQFTKVTVEADRARYQPGEQARFRIRAVDWQGKPVRAELSVAVTDASLSYIQKSYAPDIRVYYYGNRRPDSIQQGGSTGTAVQPSVEDSQARGKFQLHEWHLPEGMGLLPDWPGARGLDFGYGYYPYGRRHGGIYFREGRDEGFATDAMELSATAEPAGMVSAAAPLSGSGNFLGDGVPAASKVAKAKAERQEGGSEPGARTNFADTAFWTPAVVTDTKGEASVEVSWPDNLTRWHAEAIGNSASAQVGSGETQVVTKKDLLIRLQAPRFFVERDRVVLSANVHNYRPQAERVRVTLNLGPEAVPVLPDGEIPGVAGSGALEKWIELPKDGEKRVDWTVRVRQEGNLRVRMAARAENASDAMEESFPVLVHGVERFEAKGGVLRDAPRAEVAIHLPAERKPGSSELAVQLNPSLGAMMLDALPYLIDYPYGCIEQTVSRFVPAVVVRKTLRDLGYDLPALEERARRLAQTEGKARESEPLAGSPYTYPKGRPGSVQTAQLGRYHNPVFDPKVLREVENEGLARIAQFQHADGGWGWWPGDSSDPYMTAYVLYGLQTARDAGVPLNTGMIDRGLAFEQKRFLEDDNFHRMAYEARVLAMDNRYRAAVRPMAAGRLWENRERLSVYSKALLALALHEVGENQKAATMLRNIETTAKVDADNGTASWGESQTYWWRWWNNRVETNAAVLQAYVAIEPGATLPPMLVKWLVNNRRANTWYSTRETAMAVYALADYVWATKELSPAFTLTVTLGDQVKRSYTVNRDNALFFDNQFVVPDELLQTGDQTLIITKEGPGSLYYTAFTRYFSLEEPIRATSHEIAVRRSYFRLVPGTASGQLVPVPLDVERPNPFLTGRYELLEFGGEWTGWSDRQEGPRYQRQALKPGDPVHSGDQIEVELQLESKNDYEYLVFEDMKPAGCEPVELRSGYHGGLGLCSNMELRDQKVAFFLSSLPQGKRTLTYRLRAEIPGEFHVLPTNGYAMYAPDVRALSDERPLRILDEGQ